VSSCSKKPLFERAAAEGGQAPFNSTQIHGTHVPVEEPFTASATEITGDATVFLKFHVFLFAVLSTYSQICVSLLRFFQ
jgi:hypothetical protein